MLDGGFLWFKLCVCDFGQVGRVMIVQVMWLIMVFMVEQGVLVFRP